MFTIATWNINSLRVRLPYVLDWLQQHQPDVLALQELKLPNEDFPLSVFQDVGYHAAFSGQKTYNGVAVLSRKPASQPMTDIANLQDPQRRILGVTIHDIRIINLYVPNGESVDSEKYKYKLGWLAKMTDFLAKEIKKHAKVLVVGDFNIAPEECDVHDPLLWKGQVLFSEPERRAFQAILQQGLVDCFRLHDQSAKEFTWWDYR
ncbi:MAG: Endonuclease/exonuclease/phosphatase, partial [uncultured bacterium]